MSCKSPSKMDQRDHSCFMGHKHQNKHKHKTVQRHFNVKSLLPVNWQQTLPLLYCVYLSYCIQYNKYTLFTLFKKRVINKLNTLLNSIVFYIALQLKTRPKTNKKQPKGNDAYLRDIIKLSVLKMSKEDS